MKVLRRNVILIGCGDHYQMKYHNVLEKLKVCIHLCVDLQARQKAIKYFFSNKVLQSKKYLFLEETFRNFITPHQVSKLLKQSVNLKSIDSVLLCVEPKVKKSYIIWSAQNNLSIFMDKPINAFTPARMHLLLDDYHTMAKFIEKAKIDVIVACERRVHIGYQWVSAYLHSIHS